MDIKEFLNEYDRLDKNSLKKEQLEEFRNIFFKNGLLEKALEVSKIIYEADKENEANVISYVDNLMHLGRKAEALVILYDAKKNPQTLFMGAIIYKQDKFYDVVVDKLIQAKNMLKDDSELEFLINNELINAYIELGEGEKAIDISYSIFESIKNIETFKIVMNTLISLSKFEDAISFYEKYNNEYNDYEIYYNLATSYKYLGNKLKAKEYLLKTLELNKDYIDVYMQLGFLSSGEEAIKYLEEYISSGGMEKEAYLQLTLLYKADMRYNDIRKMVRNVLKTMGIDKNTLYISINALRQLHETEKIYDIYKEYNQVKKDSKLLVLSLLSLSEEEDYIDFVCKEIKIHHPFLFKEDLYGELLENVYNITQDKLIKRYLDENNK